MPEAFTIKGLDRAVSKLRHLGNRDAKKAVRKGLRIGAKEIRTAERGEAPERTKLLRKSITITAAKRGGKGTIGVVVWPGRKAFESAGKPFYAPYVLAGHRVRTPQGTTTRGTSARRVSPDDFVGRAFSSAASAATEAAMESIRNAILQAWQEHW